MKEKKSLSLINQLNIKLFIPVAVVMGGLLLWGIVANESFISSCGAALTWVLDNFSWAILALIILSFVALLYMIFSPFGSKIIGGPDAKPLYSTYTWIAMAICSSIGIAMMFYAVFEPLGYYTNPPGYMGIDGGTSTAAMKAIAQTTLHWGGLYYGIQIFWGILIVYLSLNKGLPFRPSSALYPIIKNKVFGPIGVAFDALAIVCMLAGTVTCFGLGTLQFSTGLQYVTGAQQNYVWYVIIIVVVTLLFSFSSARGVKRGMAIVSNLNSYLYIFLIVFLLFAGPTVRLLELLLGSVGQFITMLIPASFNGDFLNEWGGFANYNTSYYYIWTLVFSPIAGAFYAKIARGRTVRQFIIANFLIPTAFLVVWFTMWGGNAIWAETFKGANIAAQVAEFGLPSANFALLQHMPLTIITSIVTLAAVLIGFMTMADALVGIAASMTTKKTREEEAPIPIKLLWGGLTGGITLVCLFALSSTGMSALQSLAVAAGFLLLLCMPFVVVGAFKVANGSIDAFLDKTEEGQKTYEIVEAEQNE